MTAPTLDRPGVEDDARVRPHRLNAAGVCGMCRKRCGADSFCEHLYQHTDWIVCPDCDGVGFVDLWSGNGHPCKCWSGMVDAFLWGHAHAQRAARRR